MNLNTDHIKIESTPQGVILEPEYCGFLRSNGYTVNGIEDIQIVPSETEGAYVVCQVQTMQLPSDSPELDIVADTTTIPVCTCPDFRHRQSADVSESGVHPPDSGTCKHCLVYREEKARNDDQQRELGE